MKFPILVVLCSISSSAVSDGAVVDSTNTAPPLSPSLVNPSFISPSKRVVIGPGHRPPLSLAQTYSDDTIVAEFLVSEKYDGARVWWNGRHLLSRSGNIYHAPTWFTDALPDLALDGELWIGRGQFQRLMQTIRDDRPDEDAWRMVRFLVFDAPQLEGGFQQRQTQLNKLLAGQQPVWLERVVQHRVANAAQLKDMLAEVIAQGGEGLILQRADQPYFAVRHSGFLKLKPHQDDEAIVTGYKPGKGKYTGLTGSLIVLDAQGRTFRLGSGLSDADRKSPPPIGAQVTYRYQGRTESGKPRFARFLRVRPAE